MARGTHLLLDGECAVLAIVYGNDRVGRRREEARAVGGEARRVDEALVRLGGTLELEWGALMEAHLDTDGSGHAR